MEKVSTSIMRVNRQINSETMDIMYNKATFEIDVPIAGIVMCNSVHTIPPIQPALPTPNYGNTCARQDYQLQLMLLQQQNFKHSSIARLRQRGVRQGGRRRSTRSFPHFGSTPFNALSVFPVSFTSSEYGPIWRPSLSESLFNMIRSFDILIELQNYVEHFNSPSTVFTDSTTARSQWLESRMYEMTDQIHQLVGRLNLVEPSIFHLDISIAINGFEDSKEALAAAQVLLRPFDRLRNVISPRVLAIHWSRGTEELPVNLLSPSQAGRAEDNFFSGFLQRWKEKVSSPGPPPEASNASQAYWLLHAMVVDILHHVSSTIGTTFSFEGDLCVGRVAREAGDIVGLREVWDIVLKKWTDYIEGQKSLETRVSCSMALMKEMVFQSVQQATVAPNLDQTVGKGKVKVEDEDEALESFSWVDEDGTRYTQKNGQVRARLFTPSLVSYLSSVEKVQRCAVDIANLWQIREEKEKRKAASMAL
jgi:hypothetical protein